MRMRHDSKQLGYNVPNEAYLSLSSSLIIFVYTGTVEFGNLWRVKSNWLGCVGCGCRSIRPPEPHPHIDERIGTTHDCRCHVDEEAEVGARHIGDYKEDGPRATRGILANENQGGDNSRRKCSAFDDDSNYGLEVRYEHGEQQGQMKRTRKVCSPTGLMIL